MVTRAALRQELARELGRYAAGTATSGSATSLVDAGQSSPFVADDADETWEEHFVYFTSGTNLGRVRRVRKGGYNPAQYQINWDNPTALTAIAAGDSYELHAFHPDRLHRWINEALGRLSYPTRAPLTVIADGDLEATTVASWTASGATLSKVTTAAGVLFGTRALRVANTAANGYAESTSVPVEPGTSWSIAAGVRAVSGTARLVVYDQTNAAAIQTIMSTAAPYRVLYGRFSVPAGCRALTVRLGGSEASADTYWDHVQLLDDLTHLAAAPAWVTREGQIEAVEYLSLGAAQGADLFRPDLADWRGVQAWSTWTDPTGAGQTIGFRGWFPGRLLAVRGRRPYAALSSDSDETAADSEWVIAAAHVSAAMEQIQPTGAIDADRWREHLIRWSARLNQLTTTRVPRARQRIQIRGAV